MCAEKWAALLVHMLLLIDLTIYWNTKSSHVFSFPWTDIDECFEEPGICGLNTVCTNVPGTFFCSCPDGLFPSTGIFWIVGTSFCQSRQRRIWRFLKEKKKSNTNILYLHILQYFNPSIFSDLDDVVGKIVPRQVSPHFFFKANEGVVVEAIKRRQRQWPSVFYNFDILKTYSVPHLLDISIQWQRFNCRARLKKELFLATWMKNWRTTQMPSCPTLWVKTLTLSV